MMSFPFFFFLLHVSACWLDYMTLILHTNIFRNIKTQFLRNNNKGLRQTTEGFLDFFFILISRQLYYPNIFHFMPSKNIKMKCI